MYMNAVQELRDVDYLQVHGTATAATATATATATAACSSFR